MGTQISLKPKLTLVFILLLTMGNTVGCVRSFSQIIEMLSSDFVIPSESTSAQQTVALPIASESPYQTEQDPHLDYYWNRVTMFLKLIQLILKFEDLTQIIKRFLMYLLPMIDRQLKNVYSIYASYERKAEAKQQHTLESTEWFAVLRGLFELIKIIRSYEIIQFSSVHPFQRVSIYYNRQNALFFLKNVSKQYKQNPKLHHRGVEGFMRQFLNMMKYPGGMVVDADEVILDSDDLEAIIQQFLLVNTAQVSATSSSPLKSYSAFVRLLNICETLKHSVNLDDQISAKRQRMNHLLNLQDIIACFLLQVTKRQQEGSIEQFQWEQVISCFQGLWKFIHNCLTKNQPQSAQFLIYQHKQQIQRKKQGRETEGRETKGEASRVSIHTQISSTSTSRADQLQRSRYHSRQRSSSRSRSRSAVNREVGQLSSLLGTLGIAPDPNQSAQAGQSSASSSRSSARLPRKQTLQKSRRRH